RLGDAPGPFLAQLGAVLSQVSDQLAQQVGGGPRDGGVGRFGAHAISLWFLLAHRFQEPARLLLACSEARTRLLREGCPVERGKASAAELCLAAKYSSCGGVGTYETTSGGEKHCGDAIMHYNWSI